MKCIQLEITALSPLSIGRRKPGGSISETENYIPGSVIRGAIAKRSAQGAIAAQILQQANPPIDDLTQNGGDFQALFLSDEAAIFHNAYPSASGAVSQVLPATAVSSKTSPGFKSEAEERGGVFDALVDRFCAAAYNHPYDPSCPKDGGRVEPYSGFYSREGKKYHSHLVEKRLLTRVGINRRRATAEEQILYSIEVLNEVQGNNKQPTVYSSTILVEEQIAEQLARYINAHSFRLGGSTSRGLGKVAIKAAVTYLEFYVENRIAQFNQALSDRWNTWRIFGNPQQELDHDSTYFTLDLQSDAILTDQWRRTTVISSGMLRQYADVHDPSLQLHIAYSSYDYRSGWNTAWGLMKDVELVTTKGAVYLFSTTDLKPWISALTKLEITGVGERTVEGFGQVQVCSEFHQVFRERAV